MSQYWDTETCSPESQCQKISESQSQCLKSQKPVSQSVSASVSESQYLKENVSESLSQFLSILMFLCLKGTYLQYSFVEL